MAEESKERTLAWVFTELGDDGAGMRVSVRSQGLVWVAPPFGSVNQDRIHWKFKQTGIIYLRN